MVLQDYIIWIALGLYICYKREWYVDQCDYDQSTQAFVCLMATVFMPINFAIIFVKLFFINKWPK